MGKMDMENLPLHFRRTLRGTSQTQRRPDRPLGATHLESVSSATLGGDEESSEEESPKSSDEFAAMVPCPIVL